jgi:serine/threonine-protein kinase
MRANKLIGRRVADRFTITRLLGEGGMALVFVAEQDQEPREVALKIMNEELTADRSFVKRFQREAKAAARVQHPNSVALIDYGVADGLSYIAMELLAGDDLYIMLERDGAITQGRAVRIVVEVCDALMVAHELGIVHRDLKPENIMVIPDASSPNGERVKVLDFGIAKLLAPDTVAPPKPDADPTSGVTRAGTFIGTPAYMSPEQCALSAVDTRADLYTCGVLLFQLVTGKLPFEGQTPLHTATLHIHEAAPKPSTHAPNIDPRLEAIIMKALSKKPADRHQTARHLATSLRKILADLPDVRVATVGKPPPGSLRPSGRTKNSAADLSPNSDPSMESAKTMVADQDEVARPASVRLREDVREDGRAGRDSPPARVRDLPKPAPAAGRGVESTVPATPKMVPADVDDSQRTLVRPPLDESSQALREAALDPGSRHHTEVIEPPAAASALAATLGPPPAPPPPPSAAPSSAPLGGLLGGPLGKPAAPRPQGPPRPAKPTLKSAQDFKLGTGAARLGNSTLPSVPPPSQPPLVSEPPPSPPSDVGVAPVIGVGPGGLGTLQLGSAQLRSKSLPPDEEAVSTPPVRPRAEPSGVLPAPQIQVTTRMEVPDPPPLGFVPEPPFPNAQTVPMISQSVVAQAVAMGPRPAAGAPAIPPPPPSSAGGLPPPSAVAPPAPNAVASFDFSRGGVGGTAPMLQHVVPVVPPGVMPMPPNPLAPTPAPATAMEGISGARGLLIGFLAGALLMGVVAIVYAFVLRR